jgi:hypothetical protein
VGIGFTIRAVGLIGPKEASIGAIEAFRIPT